LRVCFFTLCAYLPSFALLIVHHWNLNYSQRTSKTIAACHSVFQKLSFLLWFCNVQFSDVPSQTPWAQAMLCFVLLISWLFSVINMLQNVFFSFIVKITLISSY
jgi:hypothetical protein